MKENSQIKKESKLFLRKKGLVLLAIIAVGAILAVFIDIIIGVAIILFGFAFYFLTTSKKSDKKNKEIIKKQLSFYNYFTYLLVFLENNMNVYTSLQMALEHASSDIIEDVDLLIKNIANDKTSRPYIEFARQFESDNISQLMLLIFQYEISGHNIDVLTRFQNTLTKLKQNSYEVYIEKNVSRLDIMLAIPMIATIILILVFAIGILDNIGGLINV